MGAQDVQIRGSSGLDQKGSSVGHNEASSRAGRFNGRVLWGGGSAASNVLWVIAHVRTLCGPRTGAFPANRTVTGNSRREIMRMLSRDIARKLFPLIIDALRPALASGLTPGHQTRPWCGGDRGLSWGSAILGIRTADHGCRRRPGVRIAIIRLSFY